MSLTSWLLKRKRIAPADVRLGDRIVCSDGETREVDVLGYERSAQGIYRFMFTDDTWIQYDPGQRATVQL